jgi:hypothetical protein
MLARWYTNAFRFLALHALQQKFPHAIRLADREMARVAVKRRVQQEPAFLPWMSPNVKS